MKNDLPPVTPPVDFPLYGLSHRFGAYFGLAGGGCRVGHTGALSTDLTEAVTTTAAFNNLSANNSNIGIGSLYQSGDFRFFYGNLVHSGTQSILFENITGKGVTLDHTQAIPGPSIALLAALGNGAWSVVRPFRRKTSDS